MICACYRHTNKVVVIHSYQLYGVRLEGFHSWQRVFFLYGVSAEYLTELHSFMNGTMVVIIAVVTFVAGIVGALIAKGVFKKHFQKAGIV